ncbi:MAG: hypothetical protein WC225_01665 [Acholeplasmataceae bacterium]
MRKLFIIVLNILLTSLLLVTGVFAWISFQQEGDGSEFRGRDIFMTSTNLFGVFGDVSITNSSGGVLKQYNFLDAGIQKNGDLTVKIQARTLNGYTYTENGSTYINLEVKLHIFAYANIDMRFKMIHKWETNNGVTQRDLNSFTYEYENDLTAYATSEFVFLDYTLEKNETSFYTIPIVKRIKLSGSSFSNGNDHLKITILMNGIQSNRTDKIWDAEDTNLFKETVTFSSNYNMSNMSVDFGDLTTQNGTLKNMVFKFKRYVASGLHNDSGGNYDYYYYVYHDRATKDSLTLPAGTYEVTIFSINQIELAFNQTTNPSELSMQLSTTYDNWGYEDYLYAPNIVRIWQPSTGYSANEIVYYNGSEELRGFYLAVTGLYGTEPPASPWKLYSAVFDSSAIYVQGDIAFYDGVFWMANYWTSSTPAANNNAWSSLGLAFVIQGNYSFGDIAYTVDNGVKVWYYTSSHSNNYSQIQDWSGWKLFTKNYDPVTNISHKLRKGEIVIHNGTYFIFENPNGTWGAAPPVSGSNSNYTRGVPQGEYNSSTTYSRGHIVTVTDGGNESTFMWMGASAASGVTPGAAINGWRELTDEWRPHNAYLNTNMIKEYVEYDGKTYYWNGTSESNSATAPGTARNGWIELSDIFAPFTDYYQGDFVVYDGSLWEALIDVPYDPETGANVIPRNVGSYTVWKEYPVVWDFGRN